ncbi:hypothetical protein [Priestia megaterium]|uniref:hypothetical protein n=1 Tax=Priestia megaterium TaxID=1404 RepID=UPI000BEC7B51|nr:hypothetical protein [Priestia megaterium]PED64003.1 hypothetical protein CON20_23865 [Priestia megaterium]
MNNYEYKVGDKAVVIREICGHQFELGDIVTIIKLASHQDHFEASDGKDSWYVSKDEVFPYNIIKTKLLEDLRNGR